MNTTPNSIIEKIRKLLALAERAGTEHEALVAMEKAQALLVEHGLSISEVHKDEVDFESVTQQYEWNASWIKYVAVGVAKLYLCHVYCVGNGTNSFSLVFSGSPVNIQTATYVMDVVVSTGKRLAREYGRQARIVNGDNAVSASNSFKKGFAMRIQGRCDQLVKHVMSESNGENALVVANLYETTGSQIEKWLGGKGLNFRTNRGKVRADPRHARAGAAAADRVNLRTTGLSSHNTHLLGSK